MFPYASQIFLAPRRTTSSLAAAALLVAIFAVTSPGFADHKPTKQPRHFARAAPPPYSLDVTANRVLFTPCGKAPVIYSIDDKGVQTPFATVPPLGGSDEAYDGHTCANAVLIAVSPGLGGFPKGSVYASFGTRLWVIPPDGCNQIDDRCLREVNLEPPLPSAGPHSDHLTHLIFDKTGAFEFRLIAVNAEGIWAITLEDCAQEAVSGSICGSTERIRGVNWAGEIALGQPAITPLNFKPYGGHLLVPTRGSVRFISPNKLEGYPQNYSYIPPILDPRDAPPDIPAVAAVPSELCELGAFEDRKGFFFQAHFLGIRTFRSADFEGISGSVLVTQLLGDSPWETNYPGMILLAGKGGQAPEESIFHYDHWDPPRTDGQFHGADFADCLETWTASIRDQSVGEGNSGALTPISFPVKLSPPPQAPITLRYETKDKSATAGSDYLGSTGLVIFQPGSDSQDIPLVVLGDDVEEPPEQFMVELTDPSKPGVLQARAIGTIVDDDVSPAGGPTPPGPKAPKLSVLDAGVVKELPGEAASAVFHVALAGTPPAGRRITVNYSTADGSAKAEKDYEPMNGRLIVPPEGVTIRIKVLPDEAGEPDEIFFLELSNVANATIEKGRGSATIQDLASGAVTGLTATRAAATENQSGDSGGRNALPQSPTSAQTQAQNAPAHQAQVQGMQVQQAQVQQQLQVQQQVQAQTATQVQPAVMLERQRQIEVQGAKLDPKDAARQSDSSLDKDGPPGSSFQAASLAATAMAAMFALFAGAVGTQTGDSPLQARTALVQKLPFPLHRTPAGRRRR